MKDYKAQTATSRKLITFAKQLYEVAEFSGSGNGWDGIGDYHPWEMLRTTEREGWIVAAAFALESAGFAAALGDYYATIGAEGSDAPFQAACDRLAEMLDRVGLSYRTGDHKRDPEDDLGRMEHVWGKPD